MKHLLSTIIFSVTIVTLFAQFPHRPKPKPEPSQQQKDVSEPLEKDTPEPLKKDTLKTIQTNTPKNIEEKQSKPAVVEKKFRRLDLVGLHLERGISDKNTFVFSTYLEFLFLYADEKLLPRAGIGLLPIAEFSYRHYYNLEKRQSQNKPYTKNSGHYVSGRVEFQTLLSSINPSSFDNFTSAAIGVLWGIQNNHGSITFNYEIGPGLLLVIQDDNYNNPGAFGLVLLGKLKFGFLLDR